LEEEDELQDDVDDEPELDAIDIGGQLPSLSLKNEKGEDVEIAKLADDQGIVLFLVPKADTRTSSAIRNEHVSSPPRSIM
jgi:peroxiredoxin Q/BCP